jgi:hypothetical protein
VANATRSGTIASQVPLANKSASAPSTNRSSLTRGRPGETGATRGDAGVMARVGEMESNRSLAKGIATATTRPVKTSQRGRREPLGRRGDLRGTPAAGGCLRGHQVRRPRRTTRLVPQCCGSTARVRVRSRSLANCSMAWKARDTLGFRTPRRSARPSASLDFHASRMANAVGAGHGGFSEQVGGIVAGLVMSF